MPVKEDFLLTVKDPVNTWATIRDARKRLKLYTHLNEVFMEQSYYWLYRRIRPGTTIIDIGAFIGDTAIYFALHPNVVCVRAYEPSPAAQTELLNSLHRLPKQLRYKIEFRACAVMGAEGSIKNKESGLTGSNKVEYAPGGVKAITLNTALKGLKNVAIKSDCEGAEEHIFSNADLENVYAIQLEAHNTEATLGRVLRAKGFRVSGAKAGVGYMYAEKEQ